MTYSTFNSFNYNFTFGGANLTSAFVLNPDAPVLSHRGPVEFSTCTDLVSLEPCWIWDVNGYYRDLGADPRATRKQLRVAYLSGDGPSSERMTYCLKQLLNADLRRLYDRAPLGVRLIDDYVFAEMKREAIKRAAAKGADPTNDDSVLREMRDMGMPDKVADTPEEVVVDEPSGGEQDADTAGEPEDVAPREYPWAYAYYLWRSTCRDTERLREWQELLVTAFRQRGLLTRLAVGFHGRSAHPWLLYAVGYRTVVFLHEGEPPTAEAAQAVADRVVQDTQPARPTITER